MSGHPEQSGRERIRHLLMAEVDQEISREERDELSRALERDDGLRNELETFQRLKEVTNTMSPKLAPGETWDMYFEDVYRRLERGIGWVLISLASVVLLTWGLWNVVRGLVVDTSAPVYIRWSIIVLLAGLAVLFVSVVRERLFVEKDDPYKDVVR